MSEESFTPAPLVRVAGNSAAGTSAETRCPYCHDDVPDAAGFKLLRGPVRESFRYCAACRAVHHADCWSEGTGCSACGRRFSPESIPPVARVALPSAPAVAAAPDLPESSPEPSATELARRRFVRRLRESAAPVPATRRGSLGRAGRIALAGVLAFLLLNVAGNGVAYLRCRSERARIENDADVALAGIVASWDSFEFGEAPGREGRHERLELRTHEVAERRFAALEALAAEYGGLAGPDSELPVFTERFERERARVRERCQSELAALADERTRDGLPLAPDRSWAASAEARAGECESELVGIRDAFDGGQSHTPRIPSSAWPGCWRFGWPFF